jgi:hypothetical protein
MVRSIGIGCRLLALELCPTSWPQGKCKYIIIVVDFVCNRWSCLFLQFTVLQYISHQRSGHTPWLVSHIKYSNASCNYHVTFVSFILHHIKLQYYLVLSRRLWPSEDFKGRWSGFIGISSFMFCSFSICSYLKIVPLNMLWKVWKCNSYSASVQ